MFAKEKQASLLTAKQFNNIHTRVRYYKTFCGHNGKEATVNRALDGSMYPG
jgi:hypothetical protein